MQQLKLKGLIINVGRFHAFVFFNYNSKLNFTLLNLRSPCSASVVAILASQASPE